MPRSGPADKVDSDPVPVHQTGTRVDQKTYCTPGTMEVHDDGLKFYEA